MTQSLTHINAAGEAHMVDISDKPDSARTAAATAWIRMQPNTLRRLMDGEMPKGDVFATARIAGIQAAKKTADLIPLCHPLPLTGVTLDLEADANLPGVRIRASTRTTGKTGVEMEALTAASTAALTLYDMCKGIDRHMVIGDLRVTAKAGGRSGDWTLDSDLPETGL